MRELMQYLPLLVVVLVVVSIVRNIAKAVRRLGDQAQTPLRRLAEEVDPESAARTRRIQEEIRRKIAERRGTTVLAQPPVMEPMSGSTYAPIEPPVVEDEADSSWRAEDATQAVVLERQRQLADQIHALELARATQQRRAAEIATAMTTESASERGLRAVTRASLLADLRDPDGLRRAFLLREVLGTPIGLR